MPPATSSAWKSPRTPMTPPSYAAPNATPSWAMESNPGSLPHRTGRGGLRSQGWSAQPHLAQAASPRQANSKWSFGMSPKRPFASVVSASLSRDCERVGNPTDNAEKLLDSFVKLQRYRHQALLEAVLRSASHSSPALSGQGAPTVGATACLFRPFRSRDAERHGPPQARAP